MEIQIRLIKLIYMAAKNLTKLIVWQKAPQFVLNVYLYTKGFTKEELYSESKILEAYRTKILTSNS